MSFMIPGYLKKILLHFCKFILTFSNKSGIFILKMEKTQQDSVLMPQPKFVTKIKRKQAGLGFVSNCMTTMNGSNKMFTPRPLTGSSNLLLDRKRKTFNSTGEGSPLLSNRRQSLKVLQPTAGNQDGLVGRSPTNDQDIKKLNFNLVRDSNDDKNERNVTKDQKSSRSSKRGSNNKPKLAKSVSKNSGVSIYVDSTNPSSSDGSGSEPEKPTSTKDDIYAMMTQDEAPEGYWKEIAEERRKALAHALEENKNLHNTVNDLTIENERLKKVAEQAEYFAGIIEDLLGKKMEESSDEEVTPDASTDQTTAGCKRKREDDDDDEENGLENKGARLYSSDEEDAEENVEDEVDEEEEENSLFGSYV